MTDLPSIETVLAAIDRLPADWTRPAGPDAGLKFVSWRALAYELFPKGSPLWRQPQGQPHGRHYSPAYEFMDRLGFSPAIITARLSGQQLFARKP